MIVPMECTDTPQFDEVCFCYAMDRFRHRYAMEDRRFVPTMHHNTGLPRFRVVGKPKT